VFGIISHAVSIPAAPPVPAAAGRVVYEAYQVP